MAQSTLQSLYKVDPDAKSVVEGAAGYAVFSNLGVKILVAGSGNGQGIAVDNKSKRETFMKMLELQAGLGMGVKKFRVVFVFDNEKAFNSFVNAGWQFGGQSTAAAKVGDKGAAMAGAVSVSDGVWMDQLTDKGWPSRSPPRAPSTTKMVISTEAVLATSCSGGSGGDTDPEPPSRDSPASDAPAMPLIQPV